MKKIFTLFALTISLFMDANAQKADGNIKGQLMDTAGKQPIADATISVLNAKDSSVTTFTLSNKLGVFEVKVFQEGN